MLKMVTLVDANEAYALNMAFGQGNIDLIFSKQLPKGTVLEKDAYKHIGPIPEGPLPINKYTQRYKRLVRALLNGDAVEFKEVSGKYFVKFNNKEYDLSEILEKFNPQHLDFSQEKDASDLYEKYNNNFTNGAFKQKLIGDGKVVDRFWFVTKKMQHDHLKSLNTAEMSAINVYTQDYYKQMNAIMRGLPHPDLQASNANFKANIKEVLLHIGLASSGLNKINDIKIKKAFRIEDDSLPQAVLNERINSVMSSEYDPTVTNEQGFVSSAENSPAKNFSGKYRSCFTNLTGKNIAAISAFPKEREVLMNPTQMKWLRAINAQGVYYFLAIPVRTTLGLESSMLEVSPNYVMVDLKAPPTMPSHAQFMVSKDTFEAIHYIFQNFLKESYDPQLKQFCDVDWSLKIDTNTEVFRPNHCTPHTLRVAILTLVIAEFVKACNPQEFGSLSQDDIHKAAFMMLFSVIGRGNDIGWKEAQALKQKIGRDLYAEFKEKAKQGFLKYASTKKINLFTDAEIKIWADRLDTGKPGLNTPQGKLMAIAHDIDLMRCYTPEEFKVKIDALEKLLNGNQAATKAILDYARQLIHVTGDRSMAYSPRADYNKALFGKCSLDYLSCLNALLIVPKPDVPAVAVKAQPPAQPAAPKALPVVHPKVNQPAPPKPAVAAVVPAPVVHPKQSPVVQPQAQAKAPQITPQKAVQPLSPIEPNITKPTGSNIKKGMVQVLPPVPPKKK